MKRNIEDILQGINIGIAIGLALNDNKENSLELYKNIMKNSLLPTENLEENYTQMLKKHAKADFQAGKFNQAVLQYLDIFKNAELEAEDCLTAALSLIELNQNDAAIGFLNLYEKFGVQDFLIQKQLGQVYFSLLKDYKKAIYYYENAIKICDEDADTFNILGHIYSLFYKDTRLEKQLEYFMKAFSLKKNTRLYIRNVIFTLYRLGRYSEVEDFYQKLLKLNPENNDYYFYGCFLISQKRLKEGYKYLQARFKKEDEDVSIIPAVLPQEKYWKGESLTGKAILVHCEQGFGDTILYSRFVKLLSKKARKVYFVVQDELFELMNKSNLGAEIYSTKFELARLDYDFYTTTMDLPLYLDFDIENLPYKEGYLHLPSIESHKGFKVGFAFKGNEKLKECSRDIEFESLKPLFDLKNIEFYSLQIGNNKDLPNNVSDLGTLFNSFHDTARAISGLDLIISTDNVILNLAGALGKPTLGIFNRFVDYRWFDIKEGFSTNWYDSVKVFQNKNQDEWSSTLLRVKDEINRIKEGLN